MSDLISREAILKHIEKTRQAVQFMDDTHKVSIIMNGMYLLEEAVRNQTIIMNGMYLLEEAVRNQTSAQPEPLTDKEQRTFLRAMEKEEKVCKHVDNVYNSSYEDSLVRTCHEITRKVKGALWT